MMKKIYAFLKNISVNKLIKRVSIVFNNRIYTIKKQVHDDLNFIPNHDQISWKIDSQAIQALKDSHFIQFINHVSEKNKSYRRLSELEQSGYKDNKDYYDYCIEKSIDLIRRYFDIIKLVKDQSIQKMIKKIDKYVFECPQQYFYTFEHIDLLLDTYKFIQQYTK